MIFFLKYRSKQTRKAITWGNMAVVILSWHFWGIFKANIKSKERIICFKRKKNTFRIFQSTIIWPLTNSLDGKYPNQDQVFMEFLPDKQDFNIIASLFSPRSWTSMVSTLLQENIAHTNGKRKTSNPYPRLDIPLTFLLRHFRITKPATVSTMDFLWPFNQEETQGLRIIYCIGFQLIVPQLTSCKNYAGRSPLQHYYLVY